MSDRGARLRGICLTDPVSKHRSFSSQNCDPTTSGSVLEQPLTLNLQPSSTPQPTCQVYEKTNMQNCSAKPYLRTQALEQATVKLTKPSKHHSKTVKPVKVEMHKTQSRNPKSYTMRPKPGILNSKPQTLREKAHCQPWSRARMCGPDPFFRSSCGRGLWGLG